MALASVSNFARSSMWLMGAQFLMLCTGYVVHMLLARELGPAEYGHFGKAMVGLFWVEMGLFGGLSIGLPRLIAAHRSAAPVLLRTSLLATSVLGCLLTFVAFIVAPGLASALGAEGYASTFRMAALDIVPYGLVFGLLGVLDGAASFGRKALLLAAYAVIKMLAMLGLVLVADMGPAGACLGNVFGSLGGAAVGAVLVLKPFRVLSASPGPVPEGLERELLKAAVPQGGFTLGIQLLMGLDLLAMGVQGVASSAAQGCYVAAQQLARAPYLLLTSQSAMVVPLVAGALRDGRLDDSSRDQLKAASRHLQSEIRIGVWLLGLAVALSVPIGAPLLGLLFGEAYAETGYLLSLLMIGLVSVGVYRALGLGVLAGGRTRIPLLILGGAVLLDVALNFALVPVLGSLGAAVGTAAAGLFAGGAILAYLKRSLPLRLPWASIARTCASAMAAGGVAHACRAQPLLAAIAGGTIYLFLLYVLGERRVVGDG